MVHVVLPPTHHIGTLQSLDDSRTRIQAAVGPIHPRLVLDVVFTADHRWVVLTREEASKFDSSRQESTTETHGKER